MSRAWPFFTPLLYLPYYIYIPSLCCLVLDFHQQNCLCSGGTFILEPPEKLTFSRGLWRSSLPPEYSREADNSPEPPEKLHLILQAMFCHSKCSGVLQSLTWGQVYNNLWFSCALGLLACWLGINWNFWFKQLSHACKLIFPQWKFHLICSFPHSPQVILSYSKIMRKIKISVEKITFHCIFSSIFDFSHYFYIKFN